MMAKALEPALASLAEHLKTIDDYENSNQCQSESLSWEDKLQAVRSVLACTGPPDCAGVQARSPHYQSCLADRFQASSENHVAYLPLGMGMQRLVEDVLMSMLAAQPGKHAVIVVDRPAQALGMGARLRRELKAKVAVFCGGDFLYSFQSDFDSAKVLVFTAGLLLRLVKLGTYSLRRASLLVLMDAFAVIRNHPTNTLIREYYWKMQAPVERPRLLGVLSLQLHAKPRPFDKVRQHVRKLLHSMHATLLLPGNIPTVVGAAQASNATSAGAALAGRDVSRVAGEGAQGGCSAEGAGGGRDGASRGMAPDGGGVTTSTACAAGRACAGLAEVEGALHQHPIMLHAYPLGEAERRLLAALQQHCLSLWDILHEFNLNHFGRMLHFLPQAPPPATPTGEPLTPAADGAAELLGGTPTLTPSCPPAGPAPGSAKSAPQRLGSHQALGNSGDQGDERGGVTRASPSPLLVLQSRGSAAGHLAGEGSSGSSGALAVPAAGASSAAGAASLGADPFHHDWELVEVMLRQSIWHTDLLPASGEHSRDPVALALMVHVLECVQALRVCLELGVGPCLRALHPSLLSLHELLTEVPPAITPPPIYSRIEDVTSRSPLLPLLLEAAETLPVAGWAGPAAAGEPPSMPGEPGQEGGGSGVGLLGADRVEAGQVADTVGTAANQPPLPPVKQAAGAVAAGGVDGPRASLEGPPGGARWRSIPSPDAALPQAQQAQQAELLGSSRGVQLLRLLQELLEDSQHAQQLAGLPPQLLPLPPPLLGVGEGEGEGGSLREAGYVEDAQHAQQVPLGQQAQHAGRAHQQEGAAGTASGSAQPPTPPGDGGDVPATPLAPSLPLCPPQGPSAPSASVLKVAVVTATAASAAALCRALAAVPALRGIASVERARVSGSPPRQKSGGHGGGCMGGKEGGASSRVTEAPQGHGEGGSSRGGSPGTGNGLSQEEGHPQQADPGVRLQLVVLARAEAVRAAGWRALQECSKLIWYSSSDVFHAGSHDCNSAALSFCHTLCFAREACSGGGASPPLQCHLLASEEQVAAYQEALRGDQTLKAALQLVQLGDTQFEDQLAMLSQPEGGREIGGDATTVLELVCLGLCGEPPSYCVTLADPLPPPDAPSNPTGQHAQQGPSTPDPDAPPPPPPMLFHATVTLPQSYFPAQKFHPHPSTMPTAALEGGARACQADAIDASALRALSVLHALGILSRYWPTRLLLAQSLHPRDGGWAVADEGGGGGGEGGEPPLSQHSTPGVVPLSQPASHVCPLCNVAATGLRAFAAHLAGFRHQRRVQQQALLGREVPPWLTALMAEVLQQRGRQCEMEEGEGGVEECAPGALETEMYSAVPTQYHCSTCDVYCTSALLLEAHRRGRKHQRRAGAGPATPGPGRTLQALVTPYYCALCGMYATSEDQLRMHCMGKRHARNMALQRAQRAQQTAAAGGEARKAPTPGPAPPPPGKPSQLPGELAGRGDSRQYPGENSGNLPGNPHLHGAVMVAVAPPPAAAFMTPAPAAGLVAGVSPAVGVGGGHVLATAMPSPAAMPYLAQAHGGGWVANPLMVATPAFQPALGSSTAASPPTRLAFPPPTPQLPHRYPTGGGRGEGLRIKGGSEPTLVGRRGTLPPPPPTQHRQQQLQSLQHPQHTDQQYNASRQYADMAGVIQKMQQLLAAQRAQQARLGLGREGGGSETATPTASFVPQSGGTTGIMYRCDLCGVATPSKQQYDLHLQGARHIRRQARQLAGASASSLPGSSGGTPPGTPTAAHVELQRSAPMLGSAAHMQHAQQGGEKEGKAGGEGDASIPGSLICSVCGIMATSQLNLEDHFKGRRHLKNLERLQRQALLPPPPTSSTTASQALASSLPPGVALDGTSSALESQPSEMGHLRAAVESVLLSPAPSMPGRAASGTLMRAGSMGGGFDPFPGVRVGEVDLPSSMDFRAFLDELQLEGWDPAKDFLPVIEEARGEGQLTATSSAETSPGSLEKSSGGDGRCSGDASEGAPPGQGEVRGGEALGTAQHGTAGAARGLPACDPAERGSGAELRGGGVTREASQDSRGGHSGSYPSGTPVAAGVPGAQHGQHAGQVQGQRDVLGLSGPSGRLSPASSQLPSTPAAAPEVYAAAANGRQVPWAGLGGVDSGVSQAAEGISPGAHSVGVGGGEYYTQCPPEDVFLPASLSEGLMPSAPHHSAMPAVHSQLGLVSPGWDSSLGVPVLGVGGSFPAAAQPQYWMGLTEGVGAGSGGVPGGVHMATVPEGVMSNQGIVPMPPSQAAFGVVPVAPLVPVLHPVQLQYDSSGMAVQMPAVQYAAGQLYSNTSAPSHHLLQTQVGLYQQRAQQAQQQMAAAQQGWVQLPAGLIPLTAEDQIALQLHQMQMQMQGGVPPQGGWGG